MKHLTLFLATCILSTSAASAQSKCSCPKRSHHAKAKTHAKATATTRSATYTTTSTYAAYTRPSAGKRSMASHLSLGPVIGLGGSWVSNVSGDKNFKFAPALGVGLVYSRNDHFGIGAQLLVSHEGYSTEYTMANGHKEELQINPVYLRLPVQFTYFFGNYGDRVRPKIYAGPSIAVKVDEVYHYTASNLNPTEGNYTSGNMFRTFDAGLTAGLGANIRIGKLMWLNTDIGYYHGLVDVIENDAANNFNANRNLRLNVGLMWGL
jgi:hypothetical protein